MDDALLALSDVLRRQDGVVARRQLLGSGLAVHDLQRMLRRRDLVPVHPGVYVEHTGPLTRRQREWAAVLARWPAALTGASVVPGQRTSRVVHVAIGHRRTVRQVPGVRATRMVDLVERVQWNRSPPQVAVEHAALDLAAALGSADRVAPAFALLAEVCQTRVTTPQRLVETLAARRRIPARALLVDLLGDLAVGTCSVLERGYLHRVERPHGLPTGRRQHRLRVDGRTRYTDVDHDPYGLVVELDGRAHHDGPAARDRDADRDLDTLLLRDAQTCRLTWGLVFDRSCETAAKIGRLLEARGWAGSLTPCPSCRSVGDAERASA